MMSPIKFRKIIILLCIFTIFFILCMIFQIRFNRRSLKAFSSQPINHAKSNDHPYWMPAEVNDMKLFISEPAIRKRPPPDEDVIKIWPYKGLGSERVNINRGIRDTRPFGCELVNYSEELKPVSVIIGFHNEFIGVLLRTLYAIVNLTPKHLLKEIILIDDASTEPYLDVELEQETKKLAVDKVRILRLRKRLGLSKALRIGMDTATADILVIIPSFLQPSHGWLEPLLDPIVRNPRTITTPVVEYQHWHYDDKTSVETFDGRGVFDLQLNIIELPTNVSIQNFETPIITTQILAGSKEFLKTVTNKQAVTGLDGNLLELSLKTWLCYDGQILKVPCSKFSHNFKESGAHTSIPTVGKDLKDKELKRIILKYFDDYSNKFLNFIPGRFGKSIQSLKNKEDCKPFKHFLEQVAPDMASVFINAPSRVISGIISNRKSSTMCVDVSKPSIGAVIALNSCTKTTPRYTFTKAFDIRIENKSLCWTAYETFVNRGSNVSLVALQPCNTIDPKQRFTYDPHLKTIRSDGNQFCLDTMIQKKFVALTNCNVTSLTQKWEWV